MTLVTTRPWDYGVITSTRRIVAPTELPVSLSTLAEQHLRVANDDADRDLIEMYLKAATQAAENRTQRALMPQVWEMTLNQFPDSGYIRLRRPPFIELLTWDYYDGDGEVQSLAGSPAQFGVTYSNDHGHALLAPLSGESFPATYGRRDAITIRYRAGYTDEDDPQLAHINIGIMMMVGELYEQRRASVGNVHYSPSVLRPEDFWEPVDLALA